MSEVSQTHGVERTAFGRMPPVDSPSPSTARRLLLALGLLVPLVVDPYGLDTLSVERLSLCLIGSLLLGLEATEGLFARRPLLGLAPAEALLLALIVWSAASLSWATNPMLGLAPVLMLVALLGLARTVRALTSGTAGARRWLLALTGVGLVAMALDATAIQERSTELSEDAAKYASFLFAHNNMGANYAMVLLPIGAALTLGLKSWSRLLPLLMLVGGVAYLLLLGSRSGLLFAALGLPALAGLFLLRDRVTQLRWTRRLSAALAFPLVLALAVLPFSDKARGVSKDAFYAATRLAQEYGVADLQDSGFRPHVFQKTIAMAKEVPLRGVGVANWSVEYPRFERHILDRPHAHNDALQVLAELGIPGLALFLALFASLLLTQVRVIIGSRSGVGYACALGLLGATLAFLFCGLFEVPMTMGSTASILGILIGLTCRLGEMGTRHPRLLRPNPLLSLAVIALSTAGLAYVIQRLPASAAASKAIELRKHGDEQGALSALLDVAGMRTGSWVPELQIAQLELERGEFETALLHARAARVLSPYKTELMRLEGQIFLALERFDEAVSSFQQAAEAAPGSESAQTEAIEALAQAKRLPEAIDLLTYKLQSQIRTVNIDAVLRLARYWRQLSEQEAEQQSEESRMAAMVAARHFYAVVLEDGPSSRWPEVAPEFKHMTHLLQVLPGSPDCWWPTYESFLTTGGWHRPNTALWTSMDADGVKLYPGWKEPAGPPVPRHLRNLP